MVFGSLRSDRLNRVATVGVWLTLSLIMAGSLSGQVLQSPSLTLDGPPEGQAYALIRYYQGDQPPRTIHARYDSLASTHALEFGFTGIRVLVAIPSSQPVKLSLAVDGQDPKSVTTDRPDVYELTVGDAPEDPEFVAPRVFLDATERTAISTYLACTEIEAGKTAVADSRIANIQWPTLVSHSRVREQVLGPPASDIENMHGWLSWSGNYGSRILHGPLQFQRGTAQVTLVLIGGKLFDVQFQSEELPDDWFSGPVDESLYTAEAASFLNQLITAPQDLPTAESIYRLFARRFRDTFTPDELQELRKKLFERYGASIRSVDRLSSWLEPFDAEAEWRELKIFQKVQFENGQECVFESSFAFNSRFSAIGRGNFVGFNIRDSWPSGAPGQVAAFIRFLEGLNGDGLSSELFANPLQNLLDRDRMTDSAGVLKSQYGAIVIPESFDAWSAESSGSIGYAEGVLDTQTGPVSAHVDFANDEVIAVSLWGDQSHWSSRDLLNDGVDLLQLGTRFWTRLLRGDLPDAHRFLPDDFRAQLPLSDFESLVSESGLSAVGRPRQMLADQCLIADRLDRQIPIVATTYHLATLRDGSSLPLRCEFRRTAEQWELINFTSDFEASFPLSVPEPRFERLVAALHSGDAPAVQGMLSEANAARVELEVLSAFLSQLKVKLGNFKLIQGTRSMVHYSAGSRLVDVIGNLETSVGPIPLRATFLNDRLLVFRVQSNTLAEFLLRMPDPDTYFSDRAHDLVLEWLTNDSAQLLGSWTEESDPAIVKKQLIDWKTNWQLTNGDCESVETISVAVDAKNNTANVRLRAHFANGVQIVAVQLRADAFTTRVSAIRPE